MAERETQPDPDDLEAVYAAYARELWALFYSRCSDRELAADAVQEAFWRFHSKRPSDLKDSRAWLIRVGTNWLRDRGRRKRRAAKSVESLSHVPDGRDGPDEGPLSAELRDEVREAIKRLKLEDREVLVLKYALDWSSARIASTLGVAVTAVDMRLSRARRRLAELLESNNPNRSTDRTSE
ncbi:RNA polymerase sigma factor [Stratiformator vulcanicus]|uniref:ECF RNA polymerase sigma factor SigW n=1 Tax=Stratiformator vulcanicus TaxID=2527980 RepID=A0A517QZP9_9PLAN|nr:RNA polymerase sigma factor [Stratiformator vulcanicus]QDT37127.1 ECF RNA polymerase sigma factor SigW [Stratiformator vulcanicus]